MANVKINENESKKLLFGCPGQPLWFQWTHDFILSHWQHTYISIALFWISNLITFHSAYLIYENIRLPILVETRHNETDGWWNGGYSTYEHEALCFHFYGLPLTHPLMRAVTIVDRYNLSIISKACVSTTECIIA